MLFLCFVYCVVCFFLPFPFFVTNFVDLCMCGEFLFPFNLLRVVDVLIALHMIHSVTRCVFSFSLFVAQAKFKFCICSYSVLHSNKQTHFIQPTQHTHSQEKKKEPTIQHNYNNNNKLFASKFYPKTKNKEK